MLLFYLFAVPGLWSKNIYLSTAKHQRKRESRLPSDLFMVFLVGMILGVYEVYMLLVEIVCKC